MRVRVSESEGIQTSLAKGQEVKIVYFCLPTRRVPAY